eukprot:jgi/Galph1/40/GphlegSOOS_G4878.1
MSDIGLHFCRPLVEAFNKCFIFLREIETQLQTSKQKQALQSNEQYHSMLQEIQSLIATLEATKEQVAPFLGDHTKSIVGCSFIQSKESPVNGFDSILYILLSLLNKICSLCETLNHSLFTWKSFFQEKQVFEKLIARHQQLRAFYAIVHLAAKIMETIDTSKTLLVSETLHPDFSLQRWKQAIKMEAFFGRYFGFHYQTEIRKLLRMTLIAKESVHKTLQVGQKDSTLKTLSFLGWGWFYSQLSMLEQLGVDMKYVKQLGVQVVDPPTIEQIRSFWNLVEEPFISGLSSIVSANVAIDKILSIPPESIHSWTVSIEDASHAISPLNAISSLRMPSDMVREPVQVRYISYHWRDIQQESIQQSVTPESVSTEIENSFASWKEQFSQQVKHIGVSWDGWLHGKPTTLAKGLIIHIHGGGFIAQSSSSHAVYLKDWAVDLPDACILSIDYKLAPEYKYPTALEECTYVYTWLLKYHRLLGTSAQRIVVIGDSAGGNLAVAMALKLITRGLRIPDGIVLAYPVLYLFPAWSPSRLLSLFDPLLPASVLEICMKAYLPENHNGHNDPFISPGMASERLLRQLPSMFIVVGGLDPLLDDAVEFVHRMQQLKRDQVVMELKVFPSLPHGFLNMSLVVSSALEAVRLISQWMANQLEVSWCGNAI